MNEILREIEDEIRADKLRELWAQIGPWIISGSIAIVIMTAITVGWQTYSRNREQAQAGQLYTALGEKDEAVRAKKLAELVEHRPDTSQAAFAQLHQAALLMKAEKPADAVPLYTDVAENSHIAEEIRLIARMLALHASTQANKAIIIAPVENVPAAFAPLEKEAEAWKLYADGKKEAAAAAFRAIAEDIAAPLALRTRASDMAAYLAP